MFKYLLLIAWCISAACPAEKPCLRQITIGHIGMEDVPVPSLILSTKTLRQVYADDWMAVKIVLTEEEFTKLAQLVKNFDRATHRQLPKGDLSYYGNFNVQVFNECKQVSDNSYQGKRAQDLFRFLLRNIKNFEPNNRKEVDKQLNKYMLM